MISKPEKTHQQLKGEAIQHAKSNPKTAQEGVITEAKSPPPAPEPIRTQDRAEGQMAIDANGPKDRIGAPKDWDK